MHCDETAVAIEGATKVSKERGNHCSFCLTIVGRLKCPSGVRVTIEAHCTCDLLSILIIQILISSVTALSSTQKDDSLPKPNENSIDLADK